MRKQNGSHGGGLERRLYTHGIRRKASRGEEIDIMLHDFHALFLLRCFLSRTPSCFGPAILLPHSLPVLSMRLSLRFVLLPRGGLRCNTTHIGGANWGAADWAVRGNGKSVVDRLLDVSRPGLVVRGEKWEVG